MPAEVEPILEERLGLEAELPEEGRQVPVVAAFVKKQMRDQLATAIPDGVAIDVDHMVLPEFGVAICLEMRLKRGTATPPLGGDLGPDPGAMARRVSSSGIFALI